MRADTKKVKDIMTRDVIAVRGDPLRHINVLRQPTVVIRHGRRFK